MAWETAAYAIILTLFVLGFLAIFVYTVANSKPRPDLEPRGPDAVQATIDRYDRRRWLGWIPGDFQSRTPLFARRNTASSMMGLSRRKRRPRRRRRRLS